MSKKKEAKEQGKAVKHSSSTTDTENTTETGRTETDSSRTK